MSKYMTKRVMYYCRKKLTGTDWQDLFATTIPKKDLFNDPCGDNLQESVWERIKRRDAIRKFGLEAVETAKAHHTS